MPNFDGRGPRGAGRGGYGRGQGPRNRFGQNQADEPVPQETGATEPTFYEYTLEELKERKLALAKEIEWIEARIREFEQGE